MTLGDWSRTELDQATASRRGGPGWRRHLQLELVELTSSVPRAARTPQPSGFTANLPEPAPVTKGNTASPAVGESAAPGWDECATRRIRSIYGRQLALLVGFGGGLSEIVWQLTALGLPVVALGTWLARRHTASIEEGNVRRTAFATLMLLGIGIIASAVFTLTQTWRV